ncbi:hypothetical protein ACQEU6_23840 [Spirillospora sp. CA-108201]
MRTNQNAMAVEATVVGQGWTEVFGAFMAEVADCFPRREPRLLARRMTEAMLMGLQRVNCWTLAEALGHSGPHRLQHFLSRGVWDPELACTMLERARTAGVRADHTVDTPAGAFTATRLVAKLPDRAWMRLRTGHGTKGDRHYDWAVVDVLADDDPADGTPAGHNALLVRRHRYTRELSFYRCHSAAPVTLCELVRVVCTRWRIEKDFHTAKNLAGLDQGQVTCWNSWMRWSLISLVAAAVLAIARARTARTTEQTPDLVPVSARELLRLLRAAVLPQPRRDLAHVLRWSA